MVIKADRDSLTQESRDLSPPPLLKAAKMMCSIHSFSKKLSVFERTEILLKRETGKKIREAQKKKSRTHIKSYKIRNKGKEKHLYCCGISSH